MLTVATTLFSVRNDETSKVTSVNVEISLFVHIGIVSIIYRHL